MNDKDRRPVPETELDALLAQAAVQPPAAVPERLRARLLADALEHLPPPARAATPLSGLGHLARLWQSLGGAPGFACLTAAGLAGVWIGIAPPAPVADLHAALFEGAGLVRPEFTLWGDDSPAGFGDDTLLALLARD